jgi:N-acetylneuraminate synthase
MFIADIGINHQGDVNIAKQLINVAKNCGVDVVKFQKRNPDLCVPEELKHTIKDSIFGKMKYIDYKKRLEFGKKEYDEIADYCNKIGILWTASVWDVDSVDFINEYDIPFIKVPSACITDLTLLRKVDATNRDVILSTGMSTEDEISIAIHAVRRNLKGILHCNSSYPSKDNEIDLRYMRELRDRYFLYKIGYSGHEKGYFPTLLAKALGAEILERHITLDKEMQGSDHKASLDPTELYELMRKLDNVEEILGQDKKIIYPAELEAKSKLRK